MKARAGELRGYIADLTADAVTWYELGAGYTERVARLSPEAARAWLILQGLPTEPDYVTRARREVLEAAVAADSIARRRARTA